MQSVIALFAVLLLAIICEPASSLPVDTIGPKSHQKRMVDPSQSQQAGTADPTSRFGMDGPNFGNHGNYPFNRFGGQSNMANGGHGMNSPFGGASQMNQGGPPNMANSVGGSPFGQHNRMPNVMNQLRGGSGNSPFNMANSVGGPGGSFNPPFGNGFGQNKGHGNPFMSNMGGPMGSSMGNMGRPGGPNTPGPQSEDGSSPSSP